MITNANNQIKTYTTKKTPLTPNEQKNLDNAKASLENYKIDPFNGRRSCEYDNTFHSKNVPNGIKTTSLLPLPEHYENPTYRRPALSNENIDDDMYDNDSLIDETRNGSKF